MSISDHLDKHFTKCLQRNWGVKMIGICLYPAKAK